MSIPLPHSDAVDADPLAARAPIRITLSRLVTVSAAGGPPARVERKLAALLTYLHHAGITPRGQLASLLWPEATASGARGNLRQCIYRLRRVAAGALAEDADAVALAPDVVVVEEWAGRAALLESYHYADCDDFARWLDACVDAKRTARQALLTSAMRDAVQRGDLQEAQAQAEAMLALDPESEDPYRALMEVAYLRGDHAAGVRAWDRCREVLRQLYGVLPSTATQALGAAILAVAPTGSLPAVGHPASEAESRVRSPGGLVADGRADDGDIVPSRKAAGNLGLHRPNLYGREIELAALLSAMQTHRLVTLIGMGGIGKTSLALAAAHVERARAIDVWFLDMAPLSAPERLAAAIAQMVGVSLSGHRDPVEALALVLRSSRMLLLLDNAEHLQNAVAAVAAALLAGTAHVRLLVTSRQALRVAGEQRFQVSGLATPAQHDVSDLRAFGAVALFEARAAALDSRFRLTSANAPAVADLCRHLDGVPLAIELAAARAPVLGLEALRNRLQQSLRVLGSNATIGAPRHQTLRATFDWTHALLSEEEQRLLRRLAVFVGGFTLGLAEQVAFPNIDEVDGVPRGASADPSATLDDLSGLMEKSLVVANDDDPPRYRMLEVTRAYALQKLVDAGELEPLSKLHAHAVWRLFAAAEADLNEKIRDASTRGQFLRRLTPELNNLRTARAWSMASGRDHALSIGLAATSTEALRLLGLSAEALHVMLDLRDAVDDSIPAESAELFWTGLCALGTHGRFPGIEMLGVIDKAEQLYRRVGSPRRIHVGLYRKGFALLHLGAASAAQQAVGDMGALEGSEWPARAVALRLNLQGAIDAALGHFDASIVAFKRATSLLEHQPGDEDVTLNVLSNLCMSLLGAERNEEALSVAQEVLASDPSPVVRNIAQRAVFVALTFLGRLDEASAVSRQAMTGWRNDDMLPHMLSVFAWLAYLQGRTADAFRLDGAARAQVLHKGLSNTPVFDRARAHLERVAAARIVSAEDVAQWRSEGERLRQDDVVNLCVGEGAG